MCNATDANCTMLPNMGESQQRAVVRISEYLINDSPFSDHIAEGLLLLTLCMLLLIYKIIDIVRKIMKCNSKVKGQTNENYADGDDCGTFAKDRLEEIAESMIEARLGYRRRHSDGGAIYCTVAVDESNNERPLSAKTI